MRPGGFVKVQAAWRILKNVRGAQRRMWRAAITAVFHEFQFKPQDFNRIPKQSPGHVTKITPADAIFPFSLSIRQLLKNCDSDHTTP
jgi:hypothetical protein